MVLTKREVQKKWQPNNNNAHVIIHINAIVVIDRNVLLGEKKCKLMMMMMFCIAECLIVHVYVLLTMIVGKVVVFFVCGYQKCSHDMFIFLSTIAF